MSVQQQRGRFLGQGRTVACPTCDAQPYERCLTKAGRPRSYAHPERLRKAHAVNLAPQMARDLGGRS